ncbi:type VI secretion system tip protein TssI/VgrG [Bisgaard Taxon 46]
MKDLLTSVGELSSVASKTANIVGSEKVAEKANKINNSIDKLSKATEVSDSVIHRIRTPRENIVGSQYGQLSNSLMPNSVLNRSSVPSSNLSSLVTTTSNPLMSGISQLSSLLGSPSGLQFTFKAGNLSPQTFKVVNFELSEAYSQPFVLNLLLSSAESAVNFSDVLDNQATLSIWKNGQLVRSVSGMVSAFEQGDSGFHQTFYRIEVHPTLWRLGLRRNSRIFQNESPIAILDTLLKENGVNQYRFDLRHPHPEREFCVQYRETDLDFLQRLSAEEGICYYFTQNGEQNELIFSDDAQTLNNDQAITLPYNLNKNAQLQETVVTGFSRSERVRPSQVQLKDYTFKNPTWTAEFHHQANDAENQRTGYEHYDYPGRFKDDAQGKAFSQYRLESLRQDAHQGRGVSNSGQLYAGAILSLKQHPNSSFNTLWQITRVIHRGEQPQSIEQEAGDKPTTLENRFEFIPRHQSWRPVQLTKPRVEGPQIAMVVGPKNEEIYCDNFGRIKLQFLWDRYNQADTHSSCWIRVTQPWAGKGWGMIAIPRVGQEVVVDFLEGDPDQPIVTGRTYHANNMPPGALPAAKTQMNLMSQTYKGGGYNGIMMDDATTGQKLDLHAQKDMNTKVLNNQSNNVANDQSEQIGNNQSIQVNNDQTVSVNNDQSISVNNNRSIQVQGDQTLLVKAGNRSVTVSSGDDSKDVTGNLSENVKETRSSKAKVIESTGDEKIGLTVGGGTIVMTTDAITLTFGSSTVQLNASGVFVNGAEIHLNK